MQQIKVKNVIITKIGQEDSENFSKFIKIVKEKKINVLNVEKGKRINIENLIYFDILWPSHEKMILDNSINNNSIVCKLCYRDFSVLFTGDIEKEAERQICSIYDDSILRSTVLKVAHHRLKDFF